MQRGIDTNMAYSYCHPPGGVQMRSMRSPFQHTMSSWPPARGMDLTSEKGSCGGCGCGCGGEARGAEVVVVVVGAEVVVVVVAAR